MTLDRLWILDRNEKVQAVLSNRGAACPFYDAIHKEQINGQNYLEFVVPADHPDAVYVAEENQVLYKDADNEYQLFVIKEVEDEHGDGIYKKVYCEHASSELLYFVVYDKRPQDKSASYMLSEVLSGTRWQVGIVEPTDIKSANFYYQNAYACVMDIVNLFGAEVRFRVEFTGSTVTGRYVDILIQRGSNNGKRYVYGKDVKGVRRTVDTTGLATAVIGRGKGVENEAGTGYGRKLDFADVEWSVANGDPVDKPLGQEWVGDPEALTQFGFPDGQGGYKHRTITADFEDETDPAVLLQKSWDYLQEIKNPRVTYEMDVVDLERAAGYEHESVRLGDSVLVIDRAFTPEIRIQARVIEIERNLLKPEEDKVVLGNFIEPYNVERRISDIQERVFDRTVSTSWLDGFIDAFKNELHSGNGTVRATWEGIINYDKPPEQGPTKFIKMVDGKIMLGDIVNGEENLGTFIDGKIVYADFIAAGTMLADRIRGGDLYLGGVVDGIGKDGRMYLVNSNDEIVAQLDATTKGFDELFVGKLTGNNVVTKNYDNLSIYVDPITGSDDNDGLTSSTPVASLEQAIDIIPEFNEATITINITSGSTLNEIVSITGKYGSGTIYFKFNNSTLNGYIRVGSCNQLIYIQDGTIVHTGEYHPQDGTAYACLRVYNSNWVVAQNMKFMGKNKCQFGVQCEGGNMVVTNCSLYDTSDSLIFATTGGTINAVDNVGSGAPVGIKANNTGTIAGYGTQPVGSVANTGGSAGGSVRGTWSSAETGTKPTTSSQPGKKTWTATWGHSWDTVYGWNASVPKQGNPGSWGSSGTHKGLWGFDYSNIQSTLAGKTIKSVRVKLTRKSSGGYYSSRPLYFYTHNKDSASGAEPTLSNSAGNLADFKPGESKWVNLPVSFGNALRDGTAKGIAIYINSTSQSYYVVMEDAATLEITYE
jgi:phage minor structural protein